MDSDIQFGKLEQEGPQPRVRPDRDRQYAVVGSGAPGDTDLPIFVDLDVMRDMEGHARTNTRVELGGVLLGGKFVDEDGKPFVVVSEALRAEHYEATRGSFKFTHETWAQITRDREEFPPDLKPVGWYHTHPDWGVFLSGMDMFICENFFSDELDVALVIDPCRGDRGWFHWDHQAEGRTKRRVDGFRLFANRYRRGELLHFASELAQVNPAYYDSRYETSTGGSDMQPVVHLHQQQSAPQMIALMGMLTIQTLVLALLAWRVLLPPPVESSLAQEHRNQVYREILGSLASGTPVGEHIVERVEDLGKSNLELKTSVEGQAALISQLQYSKAELQARRDALDKQLQTAISEDIKQEASIKSLQGDLAKLTAGKPVGWLTWPIAAGIALLTAVVGLVGGWLLGGSRNGDFEQPRRTGHFDSLAEHEINDE
jgi:proteasome lid subunit RPN8/RPN11